MMAEGVAVEVAIDSIESARAAREAGAARVELCAGLIEGGVTPSAGMIELARREMAIGLHVMIRPRGGDFCYSPAELAVMQQDIQIAAQAGADGVVFGVLTVGGDVDVARTAELIALARPLRVTFHRAFDMTRDGRRSLEDLINLGVERVLTSGLESSALEGLPLIADLVRQAGERIIVMPGGGITERNVGRIVAGSGVREVHISARRTVESAMRYRAGHVFMGGALRPQEFAQQVADAGRIRAVRAAAEGQR